jgi:hypothetical protein
MPRIRVRPFRAYRRQDAEHRVGHTGNQIGTVAIDIPRQQAADVGHAEIAQLMFDAIAVNDVTAAHQTDHQRTRFVAHGTGERLCHRPVPQQLALHEAHECRVAAGLCGRHVIAPHLLQPGAIARLRSSRVAHTFTAGRRHRGKTAPRHFAHHLAVDVQRTQRDLLVAGETEDAGVDLGRHAPHALPVGAFEQRLFADLAAHPRVEHGLCAARQHFQPDDHARVQCVQGSQGIDLPVMMGTNVMRLPDQHDRLAAHAREQPAGFGFAATGFEPVAGRHARCSDGRRRHRIQGEQCGFQNDRSHHGSARVGVGRRFGARS